MVFWITMRGKRGVKMPQIVRGKSELQEENTIIYCSFTNSPFAWTCLMEQIARASMKQSQNQFTW